MRHPLIDALGLVQHPEGGWYRQSWASGVDVELADGRVRPTATLIHFLLPAGDASAWHKVASDEIWIAQQGVVVLELGGSGEEPEVESQRVVGLDVEVGHQTQVLVPAGTWQRTVPREEDALVSCVVSPGFDFADFTLLD